MTEEKKHHRMDSGESDQAPHRLLADHAHPETRQISWYVVIWLAILHIGAVAAPWLITVEGIVTLFALHWLTGGIGICLGYHRLLTHGSFETYRPIRWLIALIGSLAGEGSPIEWVANHRKHHACSDQKGDPHSPLDGPWWSHVFWLAYFHEGTTGEKHQQKWAPDLLKDPVMVFLAKAFLLWQFAMGAILFATGYAWGGLSMALSLVVWGVFVRLVFVLHSTWFVNSASHIWGYRNYETTDQSRNLWWVALIAYGEGWHNNHHAYPRMAPHGHKWWELDVTYLTIRLMQAVGLAWNVVNYKQKTLQDKADVMI